MTVNGSVTIDTEAMQDVEVFGWNEIVAPDRPQHTREGIVRGHDHPGVFRDDPGHALCELAGLDQSRVRVVDEVSFRMGCQNCQGAIDFQKVIEILATHAGCH